MVKTRLQPGKKFERAILKEYGLQSRNAYNNVRKDENKIPGRVILKLNLGGGKTNWEKLAQVNDANINPTMFDVNLSNFIKADAVDKVTKNLYEIKNSLGKDEFLMTDPFAPKKRADLLRLYDAFGNVENYNRKITLIHERCGYYVCSMMAKAFRDNKIKLLTDKGILKVDKDFYFKSVIVPDRNKRNYGMLKWEIRVQLA